MTGARGLVLVACAVALACHSRSVPTVRVPLVAADTLRGTVERVGSEPLTQFVVHPSDGQACALGAAGPKVPAALEGLEVTFWGATRAVESSATLGVQCAIDVTRFAVRAVNGIDAVDGILRTDSTAFALELASGQRLPLRAVPLRMQAWVGARVFWAGPTDRPPASYGLLP